MKINKILLVMLFSIFIAACGGGGGSGGSASAAISATANTTAQSLTVGTAITSFSPLTPSGGATPYTYSYTGTLPTGLNFNSSTGAVTGTPTAYYATASLVFSVKDANNVVASTTSTVSFTVVPASNYNLAGVTANGVTLSGNLMSPITVGSHTYYYWDVNGDGTSAGTDYVLHDKLDQIFNGGTLGDNAKDTTDATGNIVTLSNGMQIHLLTQAELSALYTAHGTPTNWGSDYYAAATQVSPGVHDGVNLSGGMVSSGNDNVALSFVAFEVLSIPTQTVNYSLVGVTANGVTLSGNLMSPVTVGSHTYYYWDVSGDGTSAGSADYVLHDVLDQIFNGGTSGDNAKDTTDATGNIVTLSNGMQIHLLTQAELSALYTAHGTPTGWGGFYYAAATQVSPGVHVGVDLSNGMVSSGNDNVALSFVAFEVY